LRLKGRRGWGLVVLQQHRLIGIAPALAPIPLTLNAAAIYLAVSASWASTRNPNSTPNVAVGTVKKSIATRSFTWLSKKARQDGDDGFRCFTM
jgi:hypothetical protein